MATSSTCVPAASGRRPSDAFAAFCGQLRVGWRFCEPAEPQAKGAVERPQGYAETKFEPSRCDALQRHGFEAPLSIGVGSVCGVPARRRVAAEETWLPRGVAKVSS